LTRRCCRDMDLTVNAEKHNDYQQREVRGRSENLDEAGRSCMNNCA
jgi:hypothetical protein